MCFSLYCNDSLCRIISFNFYLSSKMLPKLKIFHISCFLLCTVPLGFNECKYVLTLQRLENTVRLQMISRINTFRSAWICVSIKHPPMLRCNAMCLKWIATDMANELYKVYIRYYQLWITLLSWTQRSMVNIRVYLQLSLAYICDYLI